MSAGTADNEMGLSKTMDFTRMSGLIVLLIHLYAACYPAFQSWQLSSAVTDRILSQILRLGLFHSVNKVKMLGLALLALSAIGAGGRRDEKITPWYPVSTCCFGVFLYFASSLLLPIPGSDAWQSVAYMAVALLGFLLCMSGMAGISRIMFRSLDPDIFNELNESFPQEERLLRNEYSINLPAIYQLKGRRRNSWINIINPFRGILVAGSPGSGKSYFVIQHVIKQHIQKGFAMLVYDFKYDDLSKIAYHTLRKNRNKYIRQPAFYLINFDDLSRSNRCNPLDPTTMIDLTDAQEASRSIMMGLNRDWIGKQGDFFVESPINFVTAIIWFLKKYQHGKCCSLPHVIELMQINYEKLFPVLKTEPEIDVLINPFLSAYRHDAMEQLEGQIASAKIGMARLSSPQLYWVLSKNEFTLDINDPANPKILCLANNPLKQQVYGAVLSLYVTRLVKLINKKNQQKCSLVFDEFPTIYFNGIDNLIATARSNKISTCLGIQDYSQLKKDYGHDQAAVIINIAGNLISGQVTGETAKLLSERFGRINQTKQSVSYHRTDTSISKSTHLDYAVPVSKIASLSSGEFVGLVADDPDQKIKLKAFHGGIINAHSALKKEAAQFEALPVIREITPAMIMSNYLSIKKDIADLIDSEMNIILNTPGMEGFL